MTSKLSCYRFLFRLSKTALHICLLLYHAKIISGGLPRPAGDPHETEPMVSKGGAEGLGALATDIDIGLFLVIVKDTVEIVAVPIHLLEVLQSYPGALRGVDGEGCDTAMFCPASMMVSPLGAVSDPSGIKY